jgi:hypothetical protein
VRFCVTGTPFAPYILKGTEMQKQVNSTDTRSAPDPSDSYERSHPEHEAGQGRLDNNSKATPTSRPDKMPAATPNVHDGGKQINGQEAARRPEQPDHSMLEEEPLGWDQTPEKIDSASSKRHPRTGGKGGTPNAGEADSRG